MISDKNVRIFISGSPAKPLSDFALPLSCDVDYSQEHVRTLEVLRLGPDQMGTFLLGG
jgi:hypothetical protein